MRHARTEDLDRIDALLVTLRGVEGIKEKSRGIFYRGSRAFIHFHEDAAGMFADVRLEQVFERFDVTTKKQQSEFVDAVRDAVTP